MFRLLAKSIPVVLLLAVALLALSAVPSALADTPNGNPARGTEYRNSDHEGNPQVCINPNSESSSGAHGHTSDPAVCSAQAPSQPPPVIVVPPLVQPNPVPAPAIVVPAPAAQPQAMVTTAPLLASCAADCVVQPGDQLGRIASQLLGDSHLFQNIVTATNAAAATNGAYHQITDPNLLSAGWRLCIPAASR